LPLLTLAQREGEKKLNLRNFREKNRVQETASEEPDGKSIYAVSAIMNHGIILC